jgi:hypothetical protein
MASVKTGYGAQGVAITITLTSLADSSTAGRESAVISNTSDAFLDVLIQGKVKPQNSGSIAAPSAAFVYAYASVDGGSDYPDAVTGADAAITLNSPTNLKLLGAIYAAAINVEYAGGPWSFAALYGGRMPEKWGIVVVNDMGTALSATSTDHVFEYQGVYATVA